MRSDPHATSDPALAVACEAARAGGRVLADGAGRNREVRLKDARTSLVTWADVHSQEAVVEVIRAAYPGHAIVGEEGRTGEPDADHAWFIDPLDGTTNYTHGLPFYCVSVALRSHGSTVCGAVYDPHHGDLYSGSRGRGATRNGVPLRVSDVERLDGALVVAQAQSDDPRTIHRFAELFERLMLVARGVRHPGAPALAMCLVAAGSLEAYCERAMDPWDILAGRLIVEEAGGRVTDFEGHPHGTVEPLDVLATNGVVHDPLLAAIAGSA